MKQMFMEAPGGRVISRITGQAVLRVEVDDMTIEDARKVMDAVMPALEARFGPGPNDDKD